MTDLLAPGGHVLADRGVVADDLQEVARPQLGHDSRGEQEGNRAEGAGGVHELAADDGHRA
ncbi:MAG TPA: hypothetical protein VOA87_07645 [Thermoanaerobaculia bacterium]|nr:hypothetical protein [Thermoanaerobaculia bacterium]